MIGERRDRRRSCARGPTCDRRPTPSSTPPTRRAGATTSRSILFRVEDVGGRGQTDQAHGRGRGRAAGRGRARRRGGGRRAGRHRHRHGRPAGGRDGADGGGRPSSRSRPGPPPRPSAGAGGACRSCWWPSSPSSPSCSRRGYFASRAVFFVGTDSRRRRDRLPRPPVRAALRAQALQRLYSSGVSGGAGAEQPSAHGARTTSCARASDADDLVRQLETRQRSVRVSARNRELFGLIPAALLVTAGFAAVFIQQRERARPTSRSPTAASSSACAWPRTSFLRFTLPDADPYLFPLVALLAGFGLVVIYRIDDDARARAGAVVRRRARRCSRRRSCSCATTACSSATAT